MCLLSFPADEALMDKLIDQLNQRQFWLEAEVLEKLFYKNKNQHRTTVHFRKMVEVSVFFCLNVRLESL